MEAFCCMHTLNLGILAHVDAGKTSLTERILFETGVISEVGRVDRGTTQADTLEMERQRGITIQSAVASFRLEDLSVNLIDTPGHSDFIAEVGRALQVLDAVILVISAVEGVQPQTRRLVRAVRSSGIPLLLFINKIDRIGARSDGLIAEIERTLGVYPLVLSTVSDLGARSASVHPRDFNDQSFATSALDLLSEHNDDVIAQYISSGDSLPLEMLRAEISRQFHDRQIVPAFFGSAITGAGISNLLDELPQLVGASPSRSAEALSGVVFKIQRTAHGEKVGLARLFSGQLCVREHVVFHRPLATGQSATYEARISGIERYHPGGIEIVSKAHACDVVRLHGVQELQVGDVSGEVLPDTSIAKFPPPTLESVIHARDAVDKARLYAALEQLEEQDPLISVRRGDRDSSISLRLYGEVQKEVIESTLHNDYGVEVHFGTSQTICIERVVGSGSAAEEMGGANPFQASVTFTVEPGTPEGGITYRRELGSLPLRSTGRLRKPSTRHYERGCMAGRCGTAS
jgi:ribosomal protection tetracycline resistance protein